MNRVQMEDEKEAIKKLVKTAVKDYKRVLVGLAHHDTGEKRANCDCCFCKPRKSSEK